MLTTLQNNKTLKGKVQDDISRNSAILFNQSGTSPEYNSTEVRCIHTYLNLTRLGIKPLEHLNEMPEPMQNYLSTHSISTFTPKKYIKGEMYFIQYKDTEFPPVLAEFVGIHNYGSIMFKYIKPYYTADQRIFINTGEAVIVGVKTTKK